MKHYFKPVVLFVLFFTISISGYANTDVDKENNQTFEPPEITDSQISLIDAIRIALEHDPNIKLEEETTNYKQGELQSETGAFDTHLLLNAEAKWTQTEMTPKQIEQEQKRRDNLRDEILDRDRADRMLHASDAYLEAQSRNINLTGQLMNFLPEDGTTLTPANITELQRTELQSDIRNDVFKDWMEFVQTAETSPETDSEDSDVDIPDVGKLTGEKVFPSDRAGVIEAQRQKSIQLDRTEIQAEIIENSKKLKEAKIEIAKLGDTPSVTEETNIIFDMSARKMLRSGIILSPGININEKGWQYRDHSQEESPIYKSQFRFDIQVPLGKGWSAESSAARETAAKIRYEASLLTLQHTVGASIYSTIKAYWNLVNAQERLKLYNKSAKNQKKMLTLSRAQVSAGDLPRAELGRIKAREANARASVSNARRELDKARLSLADTIGLQVNNIQNAPLASEQFPNPLKLKILEGLQPSDFIPDAIDKRHDYKAAIELRKATKALLRKTEIDLRPKADAGFVASYSGLSQDANVDEGLKDVFVDLTGPSFNGRFDLDWAIKNNSARGDHTRARANWRKTIITSVNLKRKIQSKVVQSLEEMKETVRQLNRNVDAVKYYKATMNSELEKFRNGDSTLIDTITTEEQLMDSMQALVDALNQYAQSLARLRFETASLYTHNNQGSIVNADDLLTLPLGKGGQ
jgi:outer membrane protein TolC